MPPSAPPSSPSTRRGRRTRRASLALIVLAAGLAPAVAPVAAARQATDPPRNGPEILAVGESALPVGDVAWRVVEDVAEPAGAAGFEERALGFLLNGRPLAGSILVTDESTGQRTVVAPDAAAFVRDGAVERRESATADVAPYLRLALVPAAARQDAGGDRLVFAGPPFAAPPGERAVTLYRDGMGRGDVDTLIGPPAPVLVLVLQGAATVRTETGEEDLAVVVASGTAYAAGSFAGPLEVVAERDATVVVLAVVGERVDGEPPAA